MCGIPVSPTVAYGIDFLRGAERERLDLSREEKGNALWIIRSVNGIWMSAKLKTLLFFLSLSAVCLVPTTYFITVVLQWPFFVKGGFCIESWSIVVAILIISFAITLAFRSFCVKAVEIRLMILAEQINSDPEKARAFGLLRQVLGGDHPTVSSLSEHVSAE